MKCRMIKSCGWIKKTDIKTTITMWASDIASNAQQTNNEIVEIRLTERDIEEAKRWGENLGTLRNSIMEGAHNHYGRLGEIVTAKYVNGTIEDDYQYDVLSETGERMEVKTKVTSRAPLPFYDCSVCAHNARQNCDSYVFVRVSNKEPLAWICGKKSRDEFFEKATYHKRGDHDSRNGYTFHADCYNIEISQLDPL